MKKITGGILGLCIIGATFATIHILNPKLGNSIFQITSERDYKEINKTLTGFIFSPKGNLVKEVPVEINGKQYSETSAYKDYFTGTIEIDGVITNIISIKDKTAAIPNLDTQKFYLALNPDPNNIKGMVQLTTSVTISKNFTTAYGYISNLNKSYGQGAFFKSDMDLKTPQEEYIQYMEEAAKRVNLYVAVMKAAFQVENGGNDFIAVKEETLEGLKEEKSKQDVLIPRYKALYKDGQWQLKFISMAIS